MDQPPDRGQLHPPIERSGTVLETDEDMRESLLSGLRSPHQNMPAGARAPISPTLVSGHRASPFRPTIRPPVPILTVLDDGRTDGEVIRLREPKFILGRTEGDLRFPMDGRMSSKHVEITHQLIGGRHRWVVTDLQSTNGMFVRVSKTALADKAEILVGNGRYRFDAGQPERDATVEHVPPEPASDGTQGMVEGNSPVRPPALTEILGREIGNRILLVKGEYWIGSEPSCQVCRPDDPFCDPRHVRLHRNSRGGWNAEHNKAQNGLWLRMIQIVVESTLQFQIGEQQFKLKVA